MPERVRQLGLVNHGYEHLRDVQLHYFLPEGGYIPYPDYTDVYNGTGIRAEEYDLPFSQLERLYDEVVSSGQFTYFGIVGLYNYDCIDYRLYVLPKSGVTVESKDELETTLREAQEEIDKYLGEYSYSRVTFHMLPETVTSPLEADNYLVNLCVPANGMLKIEWSEMLF